MRESEYSPHDEMLIYLSFEGLTHPPEHDDINQHLADFVLRREAQAELKALKQAATIRKGEAASNDTIAQHVINRINELEANGIR